MANKKVTKKESTIKKVGKDVAIVGLVAATVATGYFLYGPKGDKNRKKLKGWMLKMKGEVLEKVESLKEVNKDIYEEIVNQVTDKYKKAKNISEKEVEELSKKLKGHWSSIQKSSALKKKAVTKKKVVKK